MKRFASHKLIFTATIACYLLTSSDRLFGAAETFTNEATFISSTTPSLLESFELLPDRSLSADPIVTSAFNISLLAGTAAIRSTPTGGHHPTDGVKYAQPSTTSTLLFTFSVPQDAFALTLSDWGDAGAGTLTIQTDTGDLLTPFTIASSPPVRPTGNDLFFGFSQTAPFTQVTIVSSTTSDGYGIDGIRARAVPEPAITTFLLFGTASLLLRRRTHRTNQ